MTKIVELFTSGTTSGSSSDTYKSVFNTYYEDNRTEILILNTELSYVNLVAGDTIAKIGFFVTSMPSFDLRNVKIGIKHTSKVVLSTKFEAYQTFSEVFSSTVPKYLLQNNSWFDFEFFQTFIWNGIDNIIVTILRDDNKYANGGDWKYSVSDTTYKNRFIGMYQDSNNASPFDQSIPSVSPTNVMPWTRLIIGNVADEIKTKTVTITESFSDNILEFPIDTSTSNPIEDESVPFIYKGITALDGSFGCFESQKEEQQSLIMFRIATPPNSIKNIVNIKFAIRGTPGLTFAIVGILESEDVSQYASESNAVEFYDYTAFLSTGTHTIVVSFSNYTVMLDYSGLMQILNMSLISTFEDNSSYPIVTKIEANKSKISSKQNMNQSVITVRFDKDVTEYVARLNGSDFSTGVLVHQGGALSANTDGIVVIDWNELSSEGANKINIYGKGSDGSWTVNQG